MWVSAGKGAGTNVFIVNYKSTCWLKNSRKWVGGPFLVILMPTGQSEDHLSLHYRCAPKPFFNRELRYLKLFNSNFHF